MPLCDAITTGGPGLTAARSGRKKPARPVGRDGSGSGIRYKAGHRRECNANCRVEF